MFISTFMTSWPVHMPLPLLTWFDALATTIVLVIAFALLAGMYIFIRIVSDDSDKYKDIKEMVETIFGTPAHLRPSPPEQASAAKEGKAALVNNAAAANTPFSEPCPACDEIVTEQDSVCPSCGLQLL